MKNRSNFMITALFLCITNLSMAMGGVEFVAEVSSSSSFVLHLQNPANTTIKVILKDLEGTTLHADTYLQSGVSRQFDLKSLPQGDYWMIVKYDHQIEVQPLTKTKDLLVIDREERQTIAPPQIDQQGDYLDVKMNTLSGQSLFVKLEDDFGNTLYWRRMDPEALYQQRFNLTRLDRGRYHFSLALKGEVLVHRFSEVINLVSGV